jgi:hypothetical protein
VTVPFELRRIVARGDLPGSDGGVFNPGAVLRGERIHLLCRREIDHRSTPYVHAEEIVVDAATLAVVDHRTLVQRGYADGARLEDYRTLDYAGEALAVHTVVTADGIRPRLSRIVGDFLEPVDPMALPLPLAGIEKNWVLFEHAGALHCLYQLDPLTILVRGTFAGWSVVVREDNGWADDWQKPLSNSANLVPFAGGYLGFWHTIVGGRYVQGALLLGADLRLRGRTGVLLDGASVTAGHRPGALYVSSLVVHAGRVLAFYGEGDAHTSVAIFDAAALAAELAREPFVPLRGFSVALRAASIGEFWRKMARVEALARERAAERLWLHLDDPRFEPMVRVFGIRNLALRQRAADRRVDVDLRAPA